MVRQSFSSCFSLLTQDREKLPIWVVLFNACFFYYLNRYLKRSALIRCLKWKSTRVESLNQTLIAGQASYLVRVKSLLVVRLFFLSFLFFVFHFLLASLL